MSITATELRTNVYKIIDQVLETGVPIEITRKGKTVKIVLGEKPSKLARLVRRNKYIRGDPEELIHMDWSGEWKP